MAVWTEVSVRSQYDLLARVYSLMVTIMVIIAALFCIFMEMTTVHTEPIVIPMSVRNRLPVTHSVTMTWWKTIVSIIIRLIRRFRLRPIWYYPVSALLIFFILFNHVIYIHTQNKTRYDYNNEGNSYHCSNPAASRYWSDTIGRCFIIAILSRVEVISVAIVIYF